ncbi:type II toxin-antitoxin system RelE/ParE family toxin [Wenzhouxiangella sp. EGI_FJ10305]|uniref:type II toxin-antitoxin system RelE/ParE family toxin n=1 Tax=Wenzhouxiangella sp. EGI_FJ10305 TaxID=3243768 RepID=UPI0035E332FF
MEVLLSDKARRDFESILRYTVQQWGRRQMEAYSNTLDAAIHQISRNPEIGILRTDLKQPYRTYPTGVHVIIYRQSSRQIRILRILHQRMDPAKHY